MNLLITGAYKWTAEQISILEQISGNSVKYIEREDTPFSFDVSDVDVVICNWLFKHHDIKEFPHLRCIQLLSAGVDRIPLNYIEKKNILLFNARGVYSIPMAEYAVCGCLQLYKDSLGFYKKQKMHNWIKNRDIQELFGKRVCIIGTGSVGTEVAKRFSAFTDDVYGIDICPHESEYFKEIYDLKNLYHELRISDVTILTLPLTEETKGFFDKVAFDSMKMNSVFINIARGELVDEISLCKALENKLFGAVLDVFENEPLSESSKLWEYPNAIITPHNSFISQNNDGRLWDIIYKNLVNISSKISTN